LASRGFSGVLALEITIVQRPAKGARGHSSAHSRDERCQPAVGSATDPRRAAQARHRYRPDDRSKIHGKGKTAIVAGLEDCNHADAVASIDLFVVPTISFRLLYGFLVVRHSRREILWLGVTAHPSTEWIARQLTEACGWSEQPRYTIRDRDRAYGGAFIRRLGAMGIRDRPTSARSPWQNGYAERLIGYIRRDCLDHVVVFGEQHLRHLLSWR